MENTSLLIKYLNELNIEHDERMIGRFVEFHQLLTEWNSFMNLTAITEWDDVVLKHFADSLSIVKAGDKVTDLSFFDKDKRSGIKVLDVGTGAGFPGIPLKIAFPEFDITLLDSLKKRVGFLDEVINKLELKDINAVHGRAETYAHDPSYRQAFDFVVSRAVANLTVLSELCLPYVKVGGYFVSYKSEKADEEIVSAAKAIELLGGRFIDDIVFELPGSDMRRDLVVIYKEKETPKKYPRKEGTPAKSPLCSV
ncbi:MAG: 16S rRNA (guanine(527)-N(7))-methyltransferase RsmG [Lachnospiraceae bacterium]|nr:16S rRNA (guanine(527)-N(7))-methyltransferase RsmG [Lachnospiraceae bacterium]